ncbi:hypothetical protein D3C75_933440 [compost metagenome]
MDRQFHGLVQDTRHLDQRHDQLHEVNVADVFRTVLSKQVDQAFCIVRVHLARDGEVTHGDASTTCVSAELRFVAGHCPLGVDATDFVAVGQCRQQVKEFQARDVLIDQCFQIDIGIEGGAVRGVAAIGQQTSNTTQHEQQVFWITLGVAQFCYPDSDTASAFHAQLIAFTQNEVVDGVAYLLQPEIQTQTFKIVWVGDLGEEDTVMSGL